MSGFRRSANCVILAGFCLAFVQSKGDAAPSAACPAPVKGTGMVLNIPNGCESYRVGDTLTISWDLDSIHDGLLINFSSDGGLVEVGIGTVGSAKTNYLHGPYKWVIPDSAISNDGIYRLPAISDSCLIRIREYWRGDLTDLSDRVFSIRAANSRTRPSALSAPTRDSRIYFRDGYVNVPLHGSSRVTVATASGRVVFDAYAKGMVRCALDRGSGDVYFVRILTGSEVNTARVVAE